MQNPYHQRPFPAPRTTDPRMMQQQPPVPPVMRQPFMPPSANLPLAMAWFGDQKYGSTYDTERALERGTLFPELDKPWLAGQRRYA